VLLPARDHERCAGQFLALSANGIAAEKSIVGKTPGIYTSRTKSGARASFQAAQGD
jgi:hypothetical protein